MGPRKRSKPNPKDEPDVWLKPESPRKIKNSPSQQSQKIENESDKPGVPSTPVAESRQGTVRSLSTSLSLKKRLTRLAQPKSINSWHGGTWPRINKSTPVTQVTKESIAGLGSAASSVISAARTASPLPSRFTKIERAGSNKASSISETDVTKESVNGVTDHALDLIHADQTEKVDDPGLKQIEQNIESAGETPNISSNALSKPSRGISGNLSSVSWFGWFSTADAVNEPPVDTITGDEAGTQAPEPARGLEHMAVGRTSDVQTSSKTQKVEQVNRRSWLGMLTNSSKV